MEPQNTYWSHHSLVKNKYTKTYLKYIYLMWRILQIHLHIYVLNKNTLQLYVWCTKQGYLKPAKLKQNNFAQCILIVQK